MHSTISPDQELGKPLAGSPAPLLRSSICLAALSRDRKPQENQSEEDKQGLKVHLCVRKVMKAKDPMDPDDIETQDEAGAREHAPEK